MSGARRKRYLHDESIPLTKYAVKKIRRNIKQQEFGDTSWLCAGNNRQAQELPEELLLDDEPTATYDSTYIRHATTENYDQEFIVSMDVALANDNENVDPLYEDLYSSDEELQSMLLNKCMKSSGSIRELMDDEKFFELLSLNIERSPAELLLMVLKYSVSNSLSIQGITNLLKLVNIVCGNKVLPETRYKIDRLCNSTENVTLHGICPTCTKYIGIFQGFKDAVNCKNCDAQVDMSNPSNQCFFAMLDPSDGIRDYIESNEDFYEYVVKFRQHEKDHVSDIYDGKMYRKFVENLKDCDRHAYATVIFNTDGAPVFKSSSYSIWPIYILLNEIPLQKRLNSAITTGLWFGLNKPEMGVFLEMYVDMMNRLSEVGISCTIKKEERTIKIYSLVSCVDTIARAPMKGTSQFNAYNSCDWCYIEGEYFEGSMRFRFTIPFPKARNHNTTIMHAKQAIETNNRIFGVKTASPLLNLNNFDIIEGFTPDYMHCYAAGVAKQFTEYVLKYLRNSDIEYVNKLFKTIRSPHQMGRLSRSLEHKGDWKAREYENWVLYYSIPLLSAVLKNGRILRHWSLLVDSLHICLKTTITYAELNHVNSMLYKFVSEVENMYSLKALTYNVHQLLHLANSIYNWGPLFSHSTYPFESANHKLLKSIHCAKGIILQIVRYENIQRSIQMLENSPKFNCCGIASQYCENLAVPLIKKAFKLSNITYLGRERTVSDRTAQDFSISRRTKVFYKIVLNGSLFMTSRKENKRSCNYYAQLNNGKFVKLIDFLVDFETNQELTICQVIKTKPNKYSEVIKDVFELSDEICVKTNEIEKTCIFIQVETKMYIIPLPNQLFY